MQNSTTEEIQTKPFTIIHTFDAPRDLVWNVWTDEKHLKNWFGPKGSTMLVAKIDFRPGGSFLYQSREADGSEEWGKWMFREINPPEKIVLVQSFSNATGEVTRHPMAPTWPREMLATTTLIEKNGKTELTLEWVPINANQEEIATFESADQGMKQGWNGTFEQLEDYLRSL